jgi:hypothetical protein
MTKPIRVILGILVALILGSGIGVGSAVLAYEVGGDIRDAANGPWRTNLGAGSEHADMYTRCWVAVHELLALRQDETIYYSASVDDGGQPLSGDNIYRIEGKAPDARWWSITAYGADDFLIPNDLNRYSYSGNNLSFDSSGKFVIFCSKTQHAGTWLPLGEQKKFTLFMRLYNPGDSIRKNPATVELPHITREVGK